MSENRRRLERLESRVPTPQQEPDRPRVSDGIRALDVLIKRLRSHREKAQRDPELYDETFDEATYGMTLADHRQYVNEILAATDDGRPTPWFDECIATRGEDPRGCGGGLGT
jgi:hypothetical protein